MQLQDDFAQFKTSTKLIHLINPAHSSSIELKRQYYFGIVKKAIIFNGSIELKRSILILGVILT